MSEAATPLNVFVNQKAPYVVPASADVNFAGLDAKIDSFLSILGPIYSQLFGHPIVVTSARDSMHVASSKHGQGKAVDLRTHDLRPEWQDRFLAIVEVLADHFGLTVFDERNLPGGPHFHVEVAG